MPRADESGRAAAVEILKATSRTREYIERGESEGKSLMDAMDQGAIEGMQTFDGELERMVRAGIVTREDALAYASNQGNLLLRLGEYGKGAPAKRELKPTSDSMLNLIEP